MKTKSIKTTMLVALSLLSLTSCNEEQTNDPDTLNIISVELGYGTDWLKELAKSYEADTGHKVHVDVRMGNLGNEAIKTDLISKSSKNDLMFSKLANFTKYVYEGSITVNGKSYPNLLADVSDVWNNVASEDETKTIKEKIDSQYEQVFNIDDKYYGLPWAGGVFGFVRNISVWDSLGLTEADVPLTTDEMFDLLDKVKAQGVAPFIFSTQQNYYDSFAPIFMGQYEGVENYSNFKNGINPDGDVDEYVYTYKGALEAMKVMEKLVLKSNGYQSDKSTVDFNIMQGLFLSGKALFCVNGSWLEREMSKNYSNADVDYIRTPVISSLINKLPTVNDDAKLKEVIKYVDSLDTASPLSKPADVSDDDVQKVLEARHYSYVAGGTDHHAVIPSYSTKVELAKDFLRYMYSDKGLNVYYKTLNGNMLPANPEKGYDSNVTISKFIQSSNTATLQGYSLNRESNNKYFVLGNVNTIFSNGLTSATISLYNGEKNAQGVIDANNDYIKRHWSEISQKLW